MTIEGALLARLAAVPAVTSLIGTRVYALHLPQEPTLPATVFQQIDSVPEHAMGRDIGIRHARFQFSTWGRTPEEAMNAGDAVQNALNRYGGSTLDGTVVQEIFFDSRQTFWDEAHNEYRVIDDFIVHYEFL